MSWQASHQALSTQRRGWLGYLAGDPRNMFQSNHDTLYSKGQKISKSLYKDLFGFDRRVFFIEGQSLGVCLFVTKYCNNNNHLSSYSVIQHLIL